MYAKYGITLPLTLSLSVVVLPGCRRAEPRVGNSNMETGIEDVIHSVCQRNSAGRTDAGSAGRVVGITL
ncbi:hypothetical protein TDB9533_04431 [Thalassocella blandensis]|nr:hypothetical protein TDB9533_04431 [Thalassocella blandensis]